MKTITMLILVGFVWGCQPNPNVPSTEPSVDKETTMESNAFEDTTMVESEAFDESFAFKDSLGQFTPDSIMLETSMRIKASASICRGRAFKYSTTETVVAVVGTGPLRRRIPKCITTKYACKGDRLVVVGRTERFGICN